MRLYIVSYEEIALSEKQENALAATGEGLNSYDDTNGMITLGDLGDFEEVIACEEDWTEIKPVAEKLAYPITLWFEP